VRYAVGFGSEDLAGAAVVILAVVAAANALRDGLAVPVIDGNGQSPGKPVILCWLGVGAAIGLAAAYGAVVAMPYSYYEAALPRAFGAGLITVIAACALIDWRWSTRQARN
jgi:hypothetical protein